MLEYCGKWIPTSDFDASGLDTGYVLLVEKQGAIDATKDDGPLG